MRPRVKICCIASVHEAREAIRAGADALGLVAEMPSGPGPIADTTIAEIAATVPPPVATFLLTSRTEPEAIVEHVKLCGTNVVQLVDRVPQSVYSRLRSELPSLRIVQVIHVEGAESIEEVRGLSDSVDAFLLDSGRPNASIKKLGGTGRTHDWSISRKIVEATARPVFLAGGLNSANVSEAMRAVGAYGLDLCSGVRTSGDLDPQKLKAFMEEVASGPVL